MRNPIDHSASLIERMIGSEKIISVVLVRHCETALNAQGRVDGNSVSELTTRGRLQAKALRAHLHLIRPEWLDQSRTRWVVSPLGRARETAAALAGNEQFEVEQAFREVDVGAMQGRRWTEAIGSNILPPHQDVDLPFPEGESFKAAQTRAMAALDRYLHDAVGDLVIVTHGGIIALLILGVLGLPTEQFPFAEIDNGSCSIIELHCVDGRMYPKIKLINFAPPIDGSRSSER